MSSEAIDFKEEDRILYHRKLDKDEEGELDLGDTLGLADLRLFSDELFGSGESTDLCNSDEHGDTEHWHDTEAEAEGEIDLEIESSGHPKIFDDESYLDKEQKILELDDLELITDDGVEVLEGDSMYEHTLKPEEDGSYSFHYRMENDGMERYTPEIEFEYSGGADNGEDHGDDHEDESHGEDHDDGEDGHEEEEHGHDEGQDEEHEHGDEGEEGHDHGDDHEDESHGEDHEESGEEHDEHDHGDCDHDHGEEPEEEFYTIADASDITIKQYDVLCTELGDESLLNYFEDGDLVLGPDDIELDDVEDILSGDLGKYALGGAAAGSAAGAAAGYFLGGVAGALTGGLAAGAIGAVAGGLAAKKKTDEYEPEEEIEESYEEFKNLVESEDSDEEGIKILYGGT